MNLLKKSAFTVIGVFLLFIGLLFIILPGPAIFIIPIGLAFLAIEYPWARKILRKFQRFMVVAAAKMDKFFSK